MLLICQALRVITVYFERKRKKEGGVERETEKEIPQRCIILLSSTNFCKTAHAFVSFARTKETERDRATEREREY